MSSSPPSTELLSGPRTGIQNYEPDSSASVVTKLRKQRPTVSGLTLDKHRGLFSSPKRPDRLCRPPSLLLVGYMRLFPGGKAAGA